MYIYIYIYIYICNVPHQKRRHKEYEFNITLHTKSSIKKSFKFIKKKKEVNIS